MCMRVTYAVMLMIVMMRLSRIGSMGIYDRMTLVCWCFEMLLQPCENGVQACTILEVGEDERTFECGADLAQGHVALIQQTISPGARFIPGQTTVLEMDIGDCVPQQGQRLLGSLAGAIGVVSIPEHSD